MGGGYGGRGRGGGMGGRGMKSSGESHSLIIAAKQIDIRHDEPMLLITDFRGSSVSASGGMQKRMSVTGWEGTVLMVETTLNSGARCTHTYQLDTGTDQLVIASVANLPERQAVSYRLVYERMKSGLEDGSQE